MQSKTCSACKEPFEVYDEDTAFYARMDVPAPMHCPECRLTRRLLGRNTKSLYYRKCDLTGKRILSQYHSDQPFPVYGYEDWWGGSWDALDYGQEIDFNRPFFEQFAELNRRVPHLALFNTVGTMQNSEYNNCAGYLKNCYLCAEADYNQDCYYSNLIKKSINLVDVSVCYEDELLYECIDCMKCYGLSYSQECSQCQNSYFLFNCQSCSECIGCINQRHKQYMIFNEQYTKEEYEKRLKEFQLDTHSGVERLAKQCREFFLKLPRKNLQQEHNEGSFGDHLYNSKNAYMCFDSKDLEDCRYCARLSLAVKSSMDYTSWGDQSELVYESTACGDHAYNIKFCVMCLTNVRDLEYCIECFSSNNLFGCVGVQKKSYCILNKQYSPEEYAKLRHKLIEHMKQTGPAKAEGQFIKREAEWGTFFPYGVYGFAYNESLAMDAFPMSREEATKRGYPWRDEPVRPPQAQTYKMPESIHDTKDDVLDVVLLCTACNKNYKIIPQELTFYRMRGIPVPRNCPICRHQIRAAKRNPPKLWKRTCAKCNLECLSSYAPDKPETVYCDKCFLESVY